MRGKIFINYRREADSGFAHALFGRLESAFSANRLFMDVDNIEPGAELVPVLRKQVAECEIFLATIGKDWSEARDHANARKLDNPNDYVRIEIASALEQGKHVIPVLVGNAEMPRPDQLPKDIRSLATINAVRLTNDRFRADAATLIELLHKILRTSQEQRTKKELSALDAAAAAVASDKSLEGFLAEIEESDFLDTFWGKASLIGKRVILIVMLIGIVVRLIVYWWKGW